jgi:hypothetical protein
LEVRKGGRAHSKQGCKDRIIRAARVKVQGDGGKQVILRRPIQHLIPLEVRAQLPEPECNQPPVNSVEEEETEGARPRRKASIAADRFRAELYKRYTI